MKKRVMLSAVLIFLLACILAVGVSAEDRTITASGQCGDDLTWTLYSDGELVISGTGEMWSCDVLYDSTSGKYITTAPWGEYSESLTKLTLTQGVTTIVWWAFAGCSSLTSVTIPDSVTSIGDAAFEGCSSLTSVTLHNGVTSIGDAAFEGCSSLTSVTIPESVTTIGNYAFAECSGLTSAVVYSPAVIFGKKVFENTSIDFTVYGYAASTADGYAAAHNHRFVALEGEIEKLSGQCGDNLTWTLSDAGELVISGTGAMWDFEEDEGDNDYSGMVAPWRAYTESLTKLTLENGMTSIGANAFFECINITGTLTIPESVITIGNSAFSECSGFTGGLVIPNNVTTIGDNAFESCSGLNGSLIVGDSVETIYHEAFQYCGFTGTLKIPESVKTIGSNAFAINAFEGTVTIGSGVQLIENGAFGRLPGVTAITVDEENENYTSLDGILYSKDKTTLVCVPAGITGIYEIRDGVETIGARAFYYCDGLTEVYIPSSVRSIGDYAFYYCDGLTEVYIPGSVSTIGNSAFRHCAGLTGELIIPDGVETLGNYAFAYCSSLISVTIPDSVDTIGTYAFRNCTALESAYIYSRDVRFGSNVFRSTASNFTIYGYRGSTAETYANARGHNFEVIGSNEWEESGWCGDNLTWTIYDDGELVIEGTGAMWDYDEVYSDALECSITTAPWGEQKSRITKLTLSEGITLIGRYAFYGCDNFKGDLRIPDSVKYIDEYAFAYCDGFNGNLILGSSVVRIYDFAFYVCSGFTGDLEIPNNVKTIGRSAFEDCEGFNGTLTIGTSVKTIGEEAFDECRGFTGDLIIPNNVTKIYNDAFMECSGFDGTLTIGTGITAIEAQTFYGCSGFTGNLVIPDNVTSIGASAFYGCSGFTGDLVIPDNVTSIYSAFGNCVGLITVTIPESVITISDHSFAHCSKLTTATILGTATEFGAEVFIGTDDNFEIHGYRASTSEAYAEENNHPFVSLIAKVASGECGDNLTWTLYTGGELVIEGTGAMQDYASAAPWSTYIDQITKITLENGITSIGDNAFSGCANLTGTLMLPMSVTSIGDYSFSGCNGLTGELVIFADIVKIGDCAFSGCSGLTKVIVYTTDVTFGDDVFANTSSDFTIYGYSGSTAEVYANANSHKFKVLTGSIVDFGECGDNLTWTFYSNGELVISGTGAMWDYGVVTDSVSGTRSTSAPWGKYGDQLKKLTFTEGVTTIGDMAFSWCQGFIWDLVIPEGIVSIGTGAFNHCSGLNDELVIPASVKVIGDKAFGDCIHLTKIVVYTKDATFGNLVFGVPYTCSIYGYEDSTLKTYLMEKHYALYTMGFVNLDDVSPRPYDKCGDNLTWTIENGNLVIEGTGDMWDYSVVYDSTSCKYITAAPWGEYHDSLEITLPNGLTSIGKKAFVGCNITNDSLILPDSVISIGDYAFYNCKFPVIYNSSQSGLRIPDSIISIGKSAFYDCNSLVGELTLGNSVTTIGVYAFYGCNGFTGGLTIPSGVTTIEEYTFAGCSGFSASLTISNGVITIDEYAFSGCSGFTGQLVIPDSVETIGSYAFSGCSGFTGDLVIEGPEYFEDRWYCYNSVTGEYSTFIPDYSIDGGTLETQFGLYAQKGENWYIVASSEDNSYWGADRLRCASCSYRFYEHSIYSQEYCKWFQAVSANPTEYTVIKNNAFEGCSGISGQIVIPANMISIGDNSFAGCINAMGATIYNNDVLLGNGLFANASENFTIYGYEGSTAEAYANANGHNFVALIAEPEAIASGQCGDGVNWAFYSNGNLVISGTGDMWNFGTEEVAVNGVNYIMTRSATMQQSTGVAPWAAYSEQIKKLTISEGVTSIGANAFRGCSEIEGEVQIPESVTAIGESAFSSCSSITEVTIPASVTEIGDNAFTDCESLEKATIYSEDATFGEDVFGNTSEDFVISAPEGSTAEDYAEENNITAVPLGVTVSGTIISFLSETEIITVQLLNGDVEVASTTAVGNTATYTFEGVAPGTYTLRVSKATHATREYEVVVGDENVTQDVKIHLLGDIDGDGKINVYDAGKVNSYAKKVTFLTGYELICADVDGNGKVNVYDAGRINSHAKKVTFLW